MSIYPVIDDLPGTLPGKPVPVRSVLVGVHWTAVCSSRCGLATTMDGDKPHDHTSVVTSVGCLHQKSAQELAEYALSENSLMTSTGMAAMNSLLTTGDQDSLEVNAAELPIKKGSGKDVWIPGMVISPKGPRFLTSSLCAGARLLVRENGRMA